MISELRQILNNEQLNENKDLLKLFSKDFPKEVLYDGGKFKLESSKALGNETGAPTSILIRVTYREVEKTDQRKFLRSFSVRMQLNGVKKIKAVIDATGL